MLKCDKALENAHSPEVLITSSQPFAVPLRLRNVQSPHLLFQEGPKQANLKFKPCESNVPYFIYHETLTVINSEKSRFTSSSSYMGL